MNFHKRQRRKRREPRRLPTPAWMRSGMARSTQCMGNLKQLRLAWNLYSGDHNDRLVPNWTMFLSWPTVCLHG
jgi:hypothetical protein